MANSQAVEAALNGHPESWWETIEGAVERAEPIIRKRIRESLEGLAEELDREAKDCERHAAKESDEKDGFDAQRDGYTDSAHRLRLLLALLDSEQVEGDAEVTKREQLIDAESASADLAEYRVLVDQVGGPVELGPMSLAEAEERAAACSVGGDIHAVRVQRRNVTRSQWVDLDQGADQSLQGERYEGTINGEPFSVDEDEDSSLRRELLATLSEVWVSTRTLATRVGVPVHRDIAPVRRMLEALRAEGLAEVSRRSGSKGYLWRTAQKGGE